MQSKWNPNVKRLLKSVQAESRPVASWSATSKSLHPDVIKDPMHGNKGKPLKFKPAGKLKIKNTNPFSAPFIIQKLIMVSFSEKRFFIMSKFRHVTEE